VVVPAREYKPGADLLGGGTLILADAAGHLAVCESGHRRSGFVAAQEGYRHIDFRLAEDQLRILLDHASVPICWKM
jgi:hypothetical protein